MDVNSYWLVQFKLQTSMARTCQAGAESTDGVRGASRSAGSLWKPSFSWRLGHAPGELIGGSGYSTVQGRTRPHLLPF